MVVSWTNFTSAGAIRDVSVTAGAMRIVMANFGFDKLTALRAPIIVRRNSIQALLEEKSLDHSTLIIVSEAILRVILGWRMLISGLSNVRRWPNPVNTATILFSKGATFFCFV